MRLGARSKRERKGEGDRGRETRADEKVKVGVGVAVGVIAVFFFYPSLSSETPTLFSLRPADGRRRLATHTFAGIK